MPGSPAEACDEILDLSPEGWFKLARGFREEAKEICDNFYPEGSDERFACYVGMEHATGVSAANNACQEFRT